MKNLWKILAVAIALGAPSPALAQVGGPYGPGPVPCAYTACNIQTLTVNSNAIETAPAAAQLQFGAVDVAGSPVAQTLSVQSAAGVSNQAGANTTIDLSAGTGTGVGGNIVINGAPHSTSATTKNAPSAILTLNGDTLAATFAGAVSGNQLNSTTSVVLGATGQINFSTRSNMSSPADSQIIFKNNAGSTTLFDFGVATTSVLTVTGGLKSTTAALNFPGLGTSSAGTTGTLCWTTSTGLVNVDTTTTCLLSLEELKDIRGPISGAEALADVLALKPFWGTWKKSTPEYAGDKAEQPFLGAHQVASVDKRLAAYAPNGALHGVRYQELTAILVGAIKAQQEEIKLLFFAILLLVAWNLWLTFRRARVQR